MTYVKWFETEKEAKKYRKEHGGMLCKNIPRSHSKGYHIQAALCLGFDPEKFKYSVHKNQV